MKKKTYFVVVFFIFGKKARNSAKILDSRTRRRSCELFEMLVFFLLVVRVKESSLILMGFLGGDIGVGGSEN
jgi:hypothetical protein